MVSRRDFLKTTAAAAAGALASQPVPGFGILAKPRVAILGAGLAGLAAGYALTRNGYPVTIIEARNRIGGRVVTHSFDSHGLVAELGAEWVGESHERVRAMCDEFGLELHDNRFRTHLVYRGEYSPAGQWSYSPAWETRWNELMERYQGYTDTDKRALDKTDWWRFLLQQGITDRDLDLRELLDSTDFGESIRHVSAYAAFAEYAESSEHNEMDFKIKGGNARLPEALADRIGRQNIHFGREATEIRQAGTEVTVICAGGESPLTITADRLICALPTLAVRAIRWDPPLSEEMLWALDALQYARIAKVVTPFDERFWHDDDFDMVTDRYGHYFYHATKEQSPAAGALTAYIVGDKADVISRQDTEFKKHVIAESLQPAFGDISPLMTTNPVTYYFGSDKYSRGAYALYGKGQWYSVMPALKTPHGSVLFAGEHLADWQGFMEGAVNSGEDAAEAIVNG